MKVGCLLLILALLGLGVLTPWLGLLGDDWWHFSQLEAGNFPEAQLFENPARPGVAYLWLLFWRLFGLRLWAYYLLNVLLQWSGALLVFLILRRVFRLDVGLAAVAAALVLLYPSDTAHVYLSTITTRTATLLALAGAFLWLHVMARPAVSRILLALSLFLMLLSLLAYETFLLMFAVLPLGLYFAQHATERSWVFRWAPIYSILLGYTAFRLGTVIVVTRSREAYYATLRLEPDWLWTQLQNAFSATTWKGWLYALKSMLDWSPIGSLLFLFLALVLLLSALVWLGRSGDEFTPDRRHGVALIGIGAVLSLAGTAPVMVSNFTLENAVGTLDGRLLHGAAIGHGLVIVGLVILISSAVPSRSLQAAARNTIFAALIAVALVGGVGVQRMYARAWSAQLGIVDALRTQAPSLQDETVIAILNVPSGPFDIRFYYPLTQLVRRYYDNPTLHALPYQRDFPPDEQTVVFGEQQAYGLVELIRQEIGEFPYDQMLAFELSSYDEVTPVSEIGEAYLCDDSCLSIPFLQAEDWAPAPGPVPVNDIERFRLDQEPPKTAWRRLLDGAAKFNRRFPLP
ncbi:MAG: hypothetical protein ACC700_09345 [Anaerolineales bacterium]